MYYKTSVNSKEVSIAQTSDGTYCMGVWRDDNRLQLPIIGDFPNATQALAYAKTNVK